MMAAEFDILGPKKPSLQGFDVTKCVFVDVTKCTGGFTKTNPGVSPNLNKLDSLWLACSTRQDNIGNLLLAQKSEIHNGEVSFKYHRGCRSTYTSKEHVDRIKGQVDDPSSTSSNEPEACFRRSQISTPSFEWKQNCFLCGAQCHPKKRKTWSMVQSCIGDSATGNDMYTKVLQAAEQRNDQEMVARLYGVPNGDLVAVEARYHRSKNCFATYINERNISAHETKEHTESVIKVALHELIEEFRVSIIERRGVFLLTTLKQRYAELLGGKGVQHSEMYLTKRLKSDLAKEWPELAFIPQPGASDLVCSGDISVSDVLHKAQDLACLLRMVSDGNEQVSETFDTFTEETIIHQAVGILRRRLSRVKKLDGEYNSPEEMSAESLKKWTDSLLLKMVCWLTNKRLFDDASDVSEIDCNLPCVNIACDIITQSTAVISPKHLGLGVYLHHEYGSRKLIDMMHAMGYCISYTELRHFLTSAATHINSLQEQSPTNSYISPEVIPKGKGGHLIVAAADNWDHNERTIDGKRTTHAMTSICVQKQCPVQIQCPRITKTSSRALDLDNIKGKCTLKAKL